MSLVEFSLDHGRTLEEARAQLQRTVSEMQTRFGSFVSSVEWSDEQNRVLIKGTGFSIEVWIDATRIHLRGDIPLIGRLLGNRFVGGLKQLVERDFQKRLK